MGACPCVRGKLRRGIIAILSLFVANASRAAPSANSFLATMVALDIPENFGWVGVRCGVR